jgi:hypothetical protein
VIRTVTIAGTLLAVSLHASGATAQQAEDPRPRAALGACASGDVKKGVSILAELYAETRNPSFVFNQARCYQQNGQLEPARERFREYLRVGKNEPAEDLQRAQGYLKEIDDTLAKQAPPAPAPIIVAPPAPAAPVEGETNAHALRVTSVVLAALGVAAVGTGVVLSFKVNSTKNDVEARFANMGVVTDPQSLQQQLSDGGRYETWQWISYGIGVAALAGAATTFLVAGLPASGSAHAAEKVSLSFMPVAAPDRLGGVVHLRF